jgi:transposase
MIDADLRARIRRMYFVEHWRRGTIATQLGLHYDTVALALDLKHPPSPRKGQPGPSAVDPFVPFLRETLSQYPSLVATRLTEMIRERGYAGSPVQVRRRVRQLGLRPAPKHEAYFRLNVLPGEYGQADWGYFGRIPVEGGERRLYAFVMTLSWSRAMYLEFFTDDKLEAFFGGFVHAVEAFGGSPRVLLVDNLKSVVLERVGDLIHFHPRALECFGHYMTWGQPCAVARGNEKGRVERTIRYLRTSFWPARRFRDLDDLNRQAAAWVAAVAHQRRVPEDPDRRIVAAALDEERPRLVPLPAHPFETDRVVPIRIRKQPYVRFDGNLYSVPHGLVGRQATLAASRQTVRVLDGLAEAARHVRSYGLRQVIEDPAHLAGLAAMKRNATELRGRDRLAAAVPRARDLLDDLARRGENLGSATQRLLRLLDDHGAAELAAALGDVMASGHPSVGSVAYLLDKRRRDQGRRLDTPVHVPNRPDLTDLHVDYPSLEDYDEL